MKTPRPLPHIEATTSEVTFQGYRDAVLASMIITLDGKPVSISLRFTSVDHIMRFSTELLEAAAKVWPNDPYIEEYRA